MKNFFSLKKGAILLLMACILIITVSIIMHKMSNTNAIHEVVAFGELIWNKSIPFEVKSDKTILYLDVKSKIESDPFSNCLFVFCNRNRNKLKILHWEHNGFWLYYRRLERGKFEWPAHAEAMTTISRRELRWLLDGLQIKQIHAHREVSARTVL